MEQFDPITHQATTFFICAFGAQVPMRLYRFSTIE
jgi:hypothetical protein